MLDGIGGGLLLAPTFVDQTEGQLEQTSSNLDVAIHGRGFFAVQSGKQTLLTRNGQFMVDRDGSLILADGSGHRVLDFEGKPISLAGEVPSQVNIGPDGTISSGNRLITRLGLFDAADTGQLVYRGGTLISGPELKKLKAADGTLQSGFIERSNVDPTTEMTQLINAQRQLEANVNMIRYQDQTLGKLVNEVGKIG
jgi:flagellar basal body rod protein FlgG